MIRKTLLASLGVTATLTFSAPAQATGWDGGWHHTHYCGCGHQTCGSSSGGSTSTSGGSTTSGGSQVPEPGMLGILGLGLIGVAYTRRGHTKR